MKLHFKEDKKEMSNNNKKLGKQRLPLFLGPLVIYKCFCQ